MDGRPHVGIKKAVKSRSGQKGYLIEETEEEKSIYKWKDGKFSEADHELSSLWRITTTSEGLLKRLKDSLKSDSKLKLSDFNALGKYVNSSITNPATQQLLLVAIIQNYDIDAHSGVQIFGRWSQAGNPLIKDFATYAFHCLKVDILFLYGLTSGLIGTRPTNRIDFEYFYYLPFGNIFTSNDKLHKKLVPLLLFPHQKFIIGVDLKEDLKNIVTHLENLPIDKKKQFKNKPPIIENSTTFQLWKEFFGYPKKSNWNRDISDEKKEMMKEKMKEFEEALNGESINLEKSEDAEFIIKKSYLSKNDLCFCGSGKKVIDCCISEKEFNNIARKNMKRQQNKKRKIKNHSEKKPAGNNELC